MSALSLLVAFLGGGASFLSPCVLPIVPAYLSLAAGADLSTLQKISPRRAAMLALPGSLAFVAGFSAVFVLLGLAAAWGAASLVIARPALELFAGFALTLMGLHMLDLLRLGFLDRALSFSPPEADDQTPPWQRLGLVFLAGVAFGGAWSPCIGPILAGILTLAAASPEPWAGAVLLSVYALGLGVPFIAAALGARAFMRLSARLRKHTRLVEIIAGTALVLTGLLTLSGQLSIFANFLIRVMPFLGTLG